MSASILFLAMLVIFVGADENITCNDCEPGLPGSKGLQGESGIKGIPGKPGDPGAQYYRGSALQCGQGPCPTGIPGDKGSVGLMGKQGNSGVTGSGGEIGEPGDVGEPGRPGRSASVNGDVMYLPYKPTGAVGQVCYSFRKSCLVPGLRNGWRGWYREGQSGYMIYNKWMYFVTLSDCPCKYEIPTLPQPGKPSDCVRLGECQS